MLLDLQRQNYIFLDEFQEKLINKVVSNGNGIKYNSKEKKIIGNFEKEDILIKVPKNVASLFPTMSEQFHNAAQINNFILELTKENLNYRDEILISLDNLGCKFMEIRIREDINISQILEFLKKLSRTTIQSVDIYYKYYNVHTMKMLINLKERIFEIRWIWIFKTPDRLIQALNNKRKDGFLFISQDIAEINCGTVSPFYFSINTPTYTESIHYNSCLNCKISIDKSGEIRNCPSMKKSFGNIRNTSLEEVIQKKEFIKYGGIKKDEIAVCKDCEFRYICTDCRAYTENPVDAYSKPLKCGYDPYKGEWEEWSTNPLKQKAIKHYAMEKLVKK